MKTDSYREIRVYWDPSDPEDEGWGYRAIDAQGREESGRIHAKADDICCAIEEACFVLGARLTTDDFAIEPIKEGGYGIWIAP